MLFYWLWSIHLLLGVQLLCTVNRIKSFSAASPLTRFITGLELLLQTAQTWDRDAPTALKLTDQLMPVVELIKRWRKIEYRYGSDCQYWLLCHLCIDYDWCFFLHYLQVSLFHYVITVDKKEQLMLHVLYSVTVNIGTYCNIMLDVYFTVYFKSLILWHRFCGQQKIKPEHDTAGAFRCYVTTPFQNYSRLGQVLRRRNFWG